MSTNIRTPVIAGNWKMHKGPDATREFCRLLAEGTSRSGTGRGEITTLVFPPAISVLAAIEAIERYGLGDRLNVGVQNIHWESEGALTGEISASMVAETGVDFVLVGHSERRHIFGETNEEVRKKVAAAIERGLTPLICVGETIEEREGDRVEEVITSQLVAALEGLDKAQIARSIVAYEPVWAIGTGKTATPDDAADAHTILRGQLATTIGTPLATGVPILYGGSVRPENAAGLLRAENVDGLLIGGASLDPLSFSAIIDAAHETLS